MELIWSKFDRVGLKRILQLIHMSNQFNLLTRRYTEAEVISMLTSPDVRRLKDPCSRPLTAWHFGYSLAFHRLMPAQTP